METPSQPISFSFAKTNVVKKVLVQDAVHKEQRHAVTAISDNKFDGTDPGAAQSNKAPLVIPKQDNSYRACKKFVPSFVPPAGDAAVDNTGDKFVVAEAKVEGPVKYGLQAGVEARQAPATDSNDTLIQQWKEDAEALPEASTLEDYEALPVEEFGKALLRGMGWEEGAGLGKKRQHVDAVQYVRRPDRLGLGAQPTQEQLNRKKPKKQANAPPTQDLVAPLASDGRQRHVVKIGEKLVPRMQEGAAVGRTMYVWGGRHSGLKCRVLDLISGDKEEPKYAKVELLPSTAVVEVRVADLHSNPPPAEAAVRDPSREPSTAQASRASEADNERRQRQQQQRPSSSEGPSRPDREQRGPGRGGAQGPDGELRDREQARERERRREREREAAEPCWLAPMIRVKVVDKALRGGALYLLKAIVLDVHPGNVCDVRLDDSKEVLQALQSQLETVVPRSEGGAVLVVDGKLRGQRARLLQRNTESQMAAVQLVADMTVHRLPLDCVAQFVGSMDEEDG